MKRIAEHRTSLLLLLLLLFINSFFVDLNSPYKQPIVGDAQGYYAYLPAVFIYQDFDYSFIPKINKKYYPDFAVKSFLVDVDDEKVNKTFPGVALLYLPFFLIAHGISLLFGLTADGYAYAYQLLFLVGFWTYFLFGMIYFKKVLLELNISKKIADLSLIICVLGTNIFFYAVYDTSVTHIYNFFLVNLLIYVFLQLKKEVNIKYVLLFFVTLAIIGITRPTNFLVFGLLLFFVPDLGFYRDTFKRIFRLKGISLVFITTLIILMIPFVLWHLQTGNWIVYSYGEEGFNFSKPEIFNFLFSYTKGWFLYTPIALIILVVGFVFLFKSDKRRAVIAIIFYALAIYIFSSWWCWYYGAGMSQRVMIDYMLLLGFLLAIILQRVELKKYLHRIFLGVCFLLIGFNIAQAYQIRKGILGMGSPTKEQYWENFLSFEKRARIYPQESWKLVDKQQILFNPESGSFYSGSAYFQNDNWLINVSDTNEYSPLIRIYTKQLDTGNKVVISFEAKANSAIEQTRLTLIYNDENPVYFLKEYVHEGEWVKMEFLAEPKSLSPTYIDLYFWNAGSKESIEIRNMEFKNYYSDEYF